MTKATKTQQDKNMNYKVKLLLGSPTNGEKRKKQEVEGSTLLSALRKLKAPPTIMTVGTIEVTYGDKFKSMHMNIPRLKRLFNPKPVYAEALAKNIMLFLQ